MNYSECDKKACEERRRELVHMVLEEFTVTHGKEPTLGQLVILTGDVIPRSTLQDYRIAWRESRAQQVYGAVQTGDPMLSKS